MKNKMFLLLSLSLFAGVALWVSINTQTKTAESSDLFYLNVFALNVQSENTVLIGQIVIDEQKKIYYFNPVEDQAIEEVLYFQWSFSRDSVEKYTFDSYLPEARNLSDLVNVNMANGMEEQIVGSVGFELQNGTKESHDILLIFNKDKDFELRLIRQSEIKQSFLPKHLLLIRR